MIEGQRFSRGRAHLSPTRFRRPNFGSLELRVTVDDPKTFTKTWTSKFLWFKLLPDTEFIENICDNEKDVERIKAAR